VHAHLIAVHVLLIDVHPFGPARFQCPGRPGSSPLPLAGEGRVRVAPIYGVPPSIT